MYTSCHARIGILVNKDGDELHQHQIQWPLGLSFNAKGEVAVQNTSRVILKLFETVTVPLGTQLCRLRRSAVTAPDDLKTLCRSYNERKITVTTDFDAALADLCSVRGFAVGFFAFMPRTMACATWFSASVDWTHMTMWTWTGSVFECAAFVDHVIHRRIHVVAMREFLEAYVTRPGRLKHMFPPWVRNHLPEVISFLGAASTLFAATELLPHGDTLVDKLAAWPDSGAMEHDDMIIPPLVVAVISHPYTILDDLEINFGDMVIPLSEFGGDFAATVVKTDDIKPATLGAGSRVVVEGADRLTVRLCRKIITCTPAHIPIALHAAGPPGPIFAMILEHGTQPMDCSEIPSPP